MKSRMLVVLFLLNFGTVSGIAGGMDFPTVQGQDVLTGKTISIRPSSNKKGLVLIFLSIKCPCSNSHVQELVKLAKEYPAFDFVAVHSNQDEGLLGAKKYFAAAALPFPVLEDVDAKIADRFKALKTPHVFLMDTQGEIIYQGGVSSSADCEKAGRLYLREAFQDIAKSRPVGKANARTLGCTISRLKTRPE